MDEKLSPGRQILARGGNILLSLWSIIAYLNDRLWSWQNHRYIRSGIGPLFSKRFPAHSDRTDDNLKDRDLQGEERQRLVLDRKGRKASGPHWWAERDLRAGCRHRVGRYAEWPVFGRPRSPEEWYEILISLKLGFPYFWFYSIVWYYLSNIITIFLTNCVRYWTYTGLELVILPLVIPGEVRYLRIPLRT